MKLSQLERQEYIPRLLSNKWTIQTCNTPTIPTPTTTTPTTTPLASEILEKEYVFKDFNEAFGFITRVSLYAESKGHHPHLRNVYNRVHMGWMTHDVNGLSLKDIEAALFCDQINGSEQVEGKE